MALANEPFYNSAEDAEQQSEEDDSYSDESSDYEEDSSDYTSVPEAFEPIVPRSLKRTYGVLVDDLRSERQMKYAKLDEQLELLRAVIPPTQRDEKAHVLLDAYRYIVQLRRRVEDLNTELVPQKPPAPELRQTASAASTLPLNSTPSKPPMVEVTRKEGKLDVRIVCVHRPGLLVDIMGALDASRMTVAQANIMRHHDVLFEAFSLELLMWNCWRWQKDEDNDSRATERSADADDQGVKDNIVRAICQEGAECAL